jgi:hypothetical protein
MMTACAILPLTERKTKAPPPVYGFNHQATKSEKLCSLAVQSAGTNRRRDAGRANQRSGAERVGTRGENLVCFPTLHPRRPGVAPVRAR